MASPNQDRKEPFDTIFEVPVPELRLQEASGRTRRRYGKVKAWVRSHIDGHQRREQPSRARVQFMFNVMGAPLAPQPVETRKALAGHGIQAESLDAAKARYIVEQYVAAAGGEANLSAARSMFAMGKVRMRTTTTRKGTRAGSRSGGAVEVTGGLMVWQKKPELWCVEMVVAGGSKMSAGSDGKVTWHQTPWQQPHASRGSPRTIRCLQGLDPKSTADLFSGAAWVGEKSVDGEDCFVLRVDGKSSARVARHTMSGYFSQRTGLMVRLDDTQLQRDHKVDTSENIFREISMECTVSDYCLVDKVNVAHAGRTAVSVCRFSSDVGGFDGATDARREMFFTCMEETWSIEEVYFNIFGLSMECFLPPRDLLLSSYNHQEQQLDSVASCTRGTPDDAKADDSGIRAAVAKKVPVVTTLGWLSKAKVAAVDNLDAAADLESSTG